MASIFDPEFWSNPVATATAAASALGYKSPVAKDIEGMQQDISDLSQMRAKLDTRYQVVTNAILGDKSPRANEYLANMKQVVSQATAKTATASLQLGTAIAKGGAITAANVATSVGLEYAKLKAEAKTAANVARNMVNNALKVLDTYAEASTTAAAGKLSTGVKQAAAQALQVAQAVGTGAKEAISSTAAILPGLGKWLPYILIGGVGLYAVALMRSTVPARRSK